MSEQEKPSEIAMWSAWFVIYGAPLIQALTEAQAKLAEVARG